MLRTAVLALAVVACPAVAGAQSFASIFTQLPRDFAHLAAPSNLAILGIAGAGSLAVHPEDADIAARVNHPTAFFTPGDALGQGGWHAVAGLGVWVGGRAAHQDRVARLGVDLVQAQIVAGVLTDGLKWATDRTRPDGDQYSFPSGHTSTAFASAAVLQRHFGWKAGVPAYVLSTYVASSRLADHRHYVSDVIFGAGIGLASGRAAAFDVKNQHLTIAPQASLRFVGLTATW